MCGIAGMVSREPLGSARLDLLERMSRSLIHRGPDGEGEFRSPHAALTMRRLSIIDTATGAQPLYDESRSIVLIANGEIYNYVELRAELQQRGHVFRTGSDCEVIPHLYQELGPRCVEPLRGMFAFALWDTERRTLMLARDRMGEKPLYLHERDGELLFGSELKTLLRSGAVPFQLEPGAIDRYFHYLYVPEPETPIRGVRKLRAGHVLTVTQDPWKVEETCYWRMEDAPQIDGEPAARIRAELEAVSRIIVRSDVPVGIALSGGVDSSAIAVLAAREYPGTLQAFSVGYQGRPHSDERSDARALAEHLGLPFHEIEIAIPEVVSAFPDLVGWQDDPIADGAAFGYYAISRAAREHGVPVLLQGHGGDELFWGYPWVREAVRQSERKSRLSPSSPPRFADYLEWTRPRLWPRRAMVDWALSLAGLRTSLENLARDRASPADQLVFYDLARHFRQGREMLGKVYSQSFRDSLGDSSPYGLFTVRRPWPRLDVLMTALVCRTYLAENGIAQGDRLSMASSVELRLPLVDHRLVETVIGLRKARSDWELPPKSIFKESLRDLLPEWVHRRRKRGFQVPMRAWHRDIFAAHGHLLDGGTLVEQGILRPQAARELSAGRFPISQTDSFAFTALVLELWCRRSMSGA